MQTLSTEASTEAAPFSPQNQASASARASAASVMPSGNAIPMNSPAGNSSATAAGDPDGGRQRLDRTARRPA